MILSFATKKLRDDCQRLELADQAYGAKQAQALFGALADIEAAATADELLALYADDVAAKKDSLSITFAPQCIASFDVVPAGSASDGCDRVDWSKVRRLKLTQIKVGTDA